MFAESELNLFFLAAAIVMVYALIVRGSLKLGMPLKKEVVERGEALLGKPLSDEHRALVQHTLETLNSAWAAWASALFVLPASLTIAVQIILGARDTLEED